MHVPHPPSECHADVMLLYTGGELYYAILYSSKGSQRLDNDETGSDIDLFLLSQDIESAIERFLPSSMHADDGHSPRSIPNDARLAKEEFLPAKLNEWSGTCSNDEGILVVHYYSYVQCGFTVVSKFFRGINISQFLPKLFKNKLSWSTFQLLLASCMNYRIHVCTHVHVNMPHTCTIYYSHVLRQTCVITC